MFVVCARKREETGITQLINSFRWFGFPPPDSLRAQFWVDTSQETWVDWLCLPSALATCFSCRLSVIAQDCGLWQQPPPPPRWTLHWELSLKDMRSAEIQPGERSVWARSAACHSYYIVFTYLWCVWVTPQCTREKTENNLQDLTSSSHHTGPECETQAVRS